MQAKLDPLHYEKALRFSTDQLSFQGLSSNQFKQWDLSYSSTEIPDKSKDAKKYGSYREIPLLKYHLYRIFNLIFLWLSQNHQYSQSIASKKVPLKSLPITRWA